MPNGKARLPGPGLRIRAITAFLDNATPQEVAQWMRDEIERSGHLFHAG